MTKIDLMAEYVVACCVVHNICTLRGDEIFVITIPQRNHNNDEHINIQRENRRNAGIYKRNIIMNNLINN